jgi:2-dehydro-3-deoxyphosphogluconate aldolase / (4S)-4-hydroxy-2-oxoglutarate aldolase
MSTSVMEKILEHKLVAILRGIDAVSIVPVVEALVEGGIRLLEIPFNQRGAAEANGAPAIIAQLSRRFWGSLCIGAGTDFGSRSGDTERDGRGLQLWRGSRQAVSCR